LTQVAEKRVHEELYYHLSAFQLHVPALRERREEVPLLLGHFMNRLTRRYGVPAPHFSGALLDACQQYAWPGNLRELEVFVKRFLVFGDEAAAVEELNSHPHSGNGHGNGGSAGNGHVHEIAKNGHAAGEEQSSLKLLVRNAKGEAERSAIAHARGHIEPGGNAPAQHQLSRAAAKIREYRLVRHMMQRIYPYNGIREAK
jgi:DNA-binding NtrC family response regulator